LIIVVTSQASPDPEVSDFQKWTCLICGWTYDEAEGAPDHGLAPGTRWAAIDMNWTCPDCGARKEDFLMVPAEDLA
jgi:rubredoxin